ncbi:MAG: GAF domain-containing protein [Gemmatimonadetes bacterium]|uniref:GAF domain-containing protein n=1 Tax=Candidatus Kutchimonas denitrificans TaxID=3056748 RepID=A0AAE4Z6Y7_9BACT|nr:GAF domain-containing protein [Gemmatimonadota bacterium]NIR74874.1 GAF domain-containing protein [Candidatus Kutchimonas denitrificans]NIR99985.1 GAF domain-containing protein [Gemmatimonadota bacterium]NIT65569.1 GAF domain-containing protein [Gemmatimonadota bacterium]NIU52539.1 GAF domain-containing protein [Gemmatimonadota bacterium]
MLDPETIADELWGMAEIRPDAVVHRAVERIHQLRSENDWVGVYLLSGASLVLHSYIGADTELLRIPVGKGICGKTVAEARDINVPDVYAFEGYLARDPETRSELVVLVRGGERVLGLIEVRSHAPAAFGQGDEQAVKTIADTLGVLLAPRLGGNPPS